MELGLSCRCTPFSLKPVSTCGNVPGSAIHVVSSPFSGQLFSVELSNSMEQSPS